MRCQLGRFRAERRLTQRELAERLGIAPSTIAMYERDLRVPPGNILVAMAHVLGTTAEQILPLDPEAFADRPASGE